jgi:uncharacterized protein YcnI
MKLKLLSFLATFALLLVVLVSSVSAHVVVQPAEVGVAKRQDFTVGVPNEKDEARTTQIRLVIPEGLESVTPYVKPGWQIETVKTGEGEEAKVTEITWSGGSIDVGLRDSFVFRAMTPSEPTTLVWKSYQTYSDGTVVSWDQPPAELEGAEEESETSGPYSQTKIIDDVSEEKEETKTTATDQMTTWVSYGALLVSVVALALALRRRSA